MTAVLQNHARHTRFPIDRLGFTFQVRYLFRCVLAEMLTCSGGLVNLWIAIQPRECTAECTAL
jgi:hypothetical protein